MGRKNRAKQPTAPEPSFEVNPFAQLGELIPKESLPKPEPPKPPPPPSPPENGKLDRADQELLRAFAAEEPQTLEFQTGKVPRGPLVSLAIQRKGKGGKTVTHLRGFAELNMEDRMELAREIGRGLGTNARFLDDLLELQGDQRERATAWLSEHGFRVKTK
jgi:translation initiation factor 1 (eIF-1/SUI1)